MKVTCSALGCTFMLLALLVMNGPRVAAQAALLPAAGGVDFVAENADGAATYHIEVSMLASCLQLGCEHKLSENSAVVSEDGHALPVSVKRLGTNQPGNISPIPLHLLIVFAHGARRPSNPELERNLGRLFSAGWLVSVMRADGTFTPYSDRQGLPRELDKPVLAPVSEASAIEKAIDDLSSQDGLRILLVETGRGKRPVDPALLSQAASRLDMVYVVDGGKVETSPDCDSAAGFDTLGWLCNGTAVKKTRSYRDGVAHELTWSKAIKHLLADRKYGYDVEFTVPESAEVGLKPVTLALTDPYTYGPDPVQVEVYSIALSSRDDVVDGIRKSPGFALRVVGPSKVTGPNRSAQVENRQ